VRRFALLTVLVAAAVAVPLAFATTIATDPRDAGGKLDLRKAVAVRDGSILRLTIRTYTKWPSGLLKGKIGPSGPIGGRNQLTVLYDVNKDGRADYKGRILYFHGSLSEWIKGRHSSFEPVPVKRPNGKSAALRHPVDVFYKTPGKKTLRLKVTSVDRDDCSRACRDRIPNHGWMPVVFHVT
jgi:hypothetical protein